MGIRILSCANRISECSPSGSPMISGSHCAIRKAPQRNHRDRAFARRKVCSWTNSVPLAPRGMRAAACIGRTTRHALPIDLPNRTDRGRDCGARTPRRPHLAIGLGCVCPASISVGSPAFWSNCAYPPTDHRPTRHERAASRPPPNPSQGGKRRRCERDPEVGFRLR